MVYGEVFLDVGVGGGDVGFGLVVVVVGYEVLDGVVGEEGLEFVVELRRECFVVAQDECGSLCLRDDVGYGECFAGACYAEECLVFVARVEAIDELPDGGGLVASGLVW